RRSAREILRQTRIRRRRRRGVLRLLRRTHGEIPRTEGTLAGIRRAPQILEEGIPLVSEGRATRQARAHISRLDQYDTSSDVPRAGNLGTDRRRGGSASRLRLEQGRRQLFSGRYVVCRGHLFRHHWLGLHQLRREKRAGRTPAEYR